MRDENPAAPVAGLPPELTWPPELAVAPPEFVAPAPPGVTWVDVEVPPEPTMPPAYDVESCELQAFIANTTMPNVAAIEAVR